MFFGEMNIPRGNGTKTQYVFRNGNIEYKVYSSNPSRSRSFNFSNNQDEWDEENEENEENDDDINFGNDIINQIFNNERRNHYSYRKSHSTSGRNSKHSNHRAEGRTRRSSGDDSRRYEEEIDGRNQFSIIGAITSLIQFVIMFLLIFSVVLPYILPKIFRFS